MAERYRATWTQDHQEIEGYLLKMLSKIPGVTDAHTASIKAYCNYKISFFYEGEMCNLHFVPDGDGLIHKGILQTSSFIEGWMAVLETKFPTKLYEAICEFFPLAAHGTKRDETGRCAIDQGCYWDMVTKEQLAVAAL